MADQSVLRIQKEGNNIVLKDLVALIGEDKNLSYLIDIQKLIKLFRKLIEIIKEIIAEIHKL